MSPVSQSTAPWLTVCYLSQYERTSTLRIFPWEAGLIWQFRHMPEVPIVLDRDRSAFYRGFRAGD